MNNFYSGIDIKYFYSNQKSDYFLIDQEVAMLQTPITMEYTEIQGALGFAYKVIPYFIPYIGVSYLYSNLNPQPSVGILQIPKTTTYTDFETSTAVTRKNWGMFIGTSFISTDTVSISIENRMFNQNAFNLIGSIKF